MIKVDVISGFLGAGKTTLIKKLFEKAFKDEKVVIIENEFGEIGIDASFLKDSGVKIKEINAGCICCSLVGDFESSIKELVTTYHPDRIIIEPSGVGKLSDIVSAIKNVKLVELKLNILATVVDGSKAKIYLKNFGEFFINQVQAADTIIVSKLDKIDNSKADEIVELIKQENNHANIITTPISQLDSKELLNLLENKNSLANELLDQVLQDQDSDVNDKHHCHHHHDEDDEHEHHCCHHHDEDEDEHEHHCCHHHDEDEDEHEHHCCHHHDEDEDEHEHHCCHHHHDADEVFVSYGKETAKAFSKAELTNILDTFAKDDELGIILRSKGILKASDNEQWYYFDYVSGDYEIRLGKADYTGRIVVIGSKLDLHKIEKIIFGK